MTLFRPPNLQRLHLALGEGSHGLETLTAGLGGSSATSLPAAPLDCEGGDRHLGRVLV